LAAKGKGGRPERELRNLKSKFRNRSALGVSGALGDDGVYSRTKVQVNPAASANLAWPASPVTKRVYPANNRERYVQDVKRAGV